MKEKIIRCVTIVICICGLFFYRMKKYDTYFNSDDKLMSELGIQSKDEIIDMDEYRLGNLRTCIVKTEDNITHLVLRKCYGMVWQCVAFDRNTPEKYDEQAFTSFSGYYDRASRFGVCFDKNIDRVVLVYGDGRTEEYKVGDSGLFSFYLDIDSNIDAELIGLDKQGNKIWSEYK